jgi:hypothetical protein
MRRWYWYFRDVQTVIYYTDSMLESIHELTIELHMRLTKRNLTGYPNLELQTSIRTIPIPLLLSIAAHYPL